MREMRMNDKLNKTTLDHLVNALVMKNSIYGAVFYVSSGDNSIDLMSASGDIHEDSQYYIASINKLIISSIILKLKTNY